MRKIILMLLSVLMVSLLVVSCAPKQPEVKDETSDAEQGMQEVSAKAVSDAEVEMDLKKLSLADLDELIKVGEADKGKPLAQQAYDNLDWLALAYKVKAEKLEEAEQGTGAIEKVNHAPVFKDFSNKDGAEGQELTFKVTATDEDGDVLTYDVKDDPPGADLSKTGKFSWTPGFDKAGDYEMTFVVSDGKTTATKTVTITIANTNQPPVFSGEWEGTTKIDVTANEKKVVYLTATDADGDVVQYGVKAFPTGIVVTVDMATGKATLGAATVDQFGYLVTFTATDGVATVEKALTVLAFPKTCSKNTACPASYYCQNSTSSCTAWDLTNLKNPPCATGSSATDTQSQDACVSLSIDYWRDNTKGHNLCYKIAPDVVLNSCTVTNMGGKYVYDCSFTATCDYSNLN